MRGKEILRLVDGLHRSKDIDEEIIFRAIEGALESAAQKHYGTDEEVSVSVDRESGEIEARIAGDKVDPEDLGRIAAQTAKQIIIQRLQQAESEIIYEEYVALKGDLITGTVQRFDGSTIIVNLDKTEGVLPRAEQIPGEHYQPGERVRAMILDVKHSTHRTTVMLSRTHPDFVKRLFEIEVPEVAEGVVKVRRIAREPGERSKLAMESTESHVDAIGACVGVRGTRIKSIIDELNGEKIDIIPWQETPEMLIADSLKPAEINQMILEEGEDTKRAIVVVPEDQLALAIGRRGQNVRLAVKLTGWDIDIRPPGELDEEETEDLGEEFELEDEGGEEQMAESGDDIAADDAEEPDLEARQQEAGIDDDASQDESGPDIDQLEQEESEHASVPQELKQEE
ncbi:MAG: transcription termination factor NusA [Planctomycetota bacterium]